MTLPEVTQGLSRNWDLYPNLGRQTQSSFQLLDPPKAAVNGEPQPGPVRRLDPKEVEPDSERWLGKGTSS